MKQYIKITCRYYGEDDLVKNGRSRNGTQRYLCKLCGKNFQTDYSYNAWRPGVKEQIEIQTLNSSIILAWHNGRRTDESCACLMEKLSDFQVKYYYTDNWRSYSKYFSSHKHIIGKDNTWKIERKNLNFRTHIKRLHRKTICFSKNEKNTLQYHWIVYQPILF